MNKQKIRISFLRTLAVAACCALTMASCDDDMGSQEVPNEPYVLSLGITSNGTTTYYVVTTADLMSSTPINAYGKGIEQNGYRDYQQAGQTVFHFHVHIIPRYAGAPKIVTWTPGSPSKEELAEIGSRIREAL